MGAGAARVIACRQTFALQEFGAEPPVEGSRSHPVEADAVVEVVTAQECAVKERAHHEVISVRVAFVEIAKLRQKTTGARLQAAGQAGRFQISLLDTRIDLVVITVGNAAQAGVQPGRDIEISRDVAVAQTQALVAM